MSDANDDKTNDGQGSGAGGPRSPLSLKPRQAGSVSTGTVRQSFSHGRTKTVVVETKRRRAEGGPAQPDKRQAFDVARPRPAAAEAPARPAQAPARPAETGGLSTEEMEARRRAIALANREREEREAQRRAEEAARQAEEARRRASAEASAPAAAPTPAPAQPAAPPPAAAAPAVEAPRPAPTAQASAPEPRQPREAPAARFGQRAPRPDRAGDRPPQGGYRGDRPQGDRPQGDRGQGGYRSDRPQGDRGQGDRPQGGERAFTPRTADRAGFGARPPREGGRPPGDRGPRPAGDTVRYSAVTPRPAGPRPAGAGGGFRGAEPPSGPEVSRPSRAPGGRGPDRKPAHLEEAERARRAKNAANVEGKAVSRVKGAPQRREGRLTIQALAGGDEDAAERMRSLASVRRAREREREKRKGGAVEQPRVVRDVVIPDVITVQELSNRMAVRGVDVIKFLMRQGMMLKINDVIDSDTAELVATEFGHNVTRVSESDVEEGFLDATADASDAPPRPPVIAVMGHVDHGKTSLLDALRKTDVAAAESGGITQHIGAYQVRLEDGQRVTFLDTPGHAAFSAMRARGANVTDIVVLVVAADDGVMPQTAEAIQHARAANAPLIVAINKIDKPDATPQKVINELLQHEVVVESLGGETQAVEVSAKTGQGLDNLLESILVQAELMDLRANPDRTAEGVVIEAKLDKGRGPVATVLVKRGTLRRGDIVVAGSQWGRVRALLNERGEQLAEAGPSVPVEILGLDGAPDPGEAVAVVEDEARAREITEFRERKRREKATSPQAAVSLADMMSRLQDKKLKELPVVIKADVQGSAEAIVGALDKLGTDEVRARAILSGAGGITESDVTLAKGAGASILGFNVRASAQARQLAAREGVEIRYYSIIYDLIDDIKGVLSGMLAPIQRETFLGNAQVLEVFDITRVGKVAGCRVTEGVVRRGARVRIVRDDVVVLELGVLETLKRFKDDVAEVTNGYECGMAFKGFQDIKPGDLIECFTLEEVARTLD